MIKFKRILFHTRFREFSLNSLEAVLDLKHADLEEVILTYVIPREDVAFTPYGGYLEDEEKRLETEARISFQDHEKTIHAHGLTSKTVIEEGELNPTLLSIAKREKADMIVTGRKKRSLFEKIYVGSHILDLLRRSEIPVLMGKYKAQYTVDNETFTRTNDHIFQRPMLATDWSQPSRNALDALTAFKGAIQCALITHVIDEKIIKDVDESKVQTIQSETRNRLDEYLRIMQEAEIEAESHTAVGKAVKEIIRLSRDHKATMIVMGRTGKDWFEEYWLGGAAHRVAEISELPVLLIS